MRTPFMLTASAIALMAFSTGAFAQSDGGAIRIGQSVSGTTDGEGTLYRINLRAGDGIEVVMRSESIDAFLAIQKDGDEEPILTDDDGLGSGTDSRLRFVASENGTYAIRASAFGDNSGDYSLNVSNWRPERVRSSNIRVGDEVSGTLNNRSPMSDQGERIQQYMIRLNRGERIEINLSASDFDPVVSIGRENYGQYLEIDRNDDGPDGLNSRIFFTAPEAGAYVIRAKSIEESPTGSFSLSVKTGKPLGELRPVTAGAVMRGELSAQTEPGLSGIAAHRYALPVNGGEHYEITLKSSDFDAYLAIYDENGQEVASDDDSAGALDASVIFSPNKSGNYVIEARGLSNVTGAYDLTVETVEAPPAPTPLPFNQDVEGELTDEDARASAASRYDAYSFTATEGQRLQITLASADFDAQLEVSSAEGTFEAFASDDDGLGSGTDSRLVFEVPSDGEYVVRASSFDGSGRGNYEIRMIDRGPAPQPGSLLVGSTVRGSLSEFDNTADGGLGGSPYYDDYKFTAKRDEKLRFILVAPQFDAVVMVGQGAGEEFSVSKQDDDGLSDTHSRLNWNVPRDGEYVVRVTSFSANATGEYSLIVERQTRN